MKLNKNFYLKPTLTVARELIGCVLVREKSDEITSGKIVETEAYLGFEDRGSHSYKNKHTPSMDPLYKSGGHCYIFPIYGIGYCFNVVTESENVPRAVLIRALEPIDGIDLMVKRRNFSRTNPSNLKNLTNGPVKLCEAMDIDAKISGNNLCGDELFILGQKLGTNEKILTSTRINIDYAEEDQFKPWRFILEGNKFLSRKV